MTLIVLDFMAEQVRVTPPSSYATRRNKKSNAWFDTEMNEMNL